ncbi:unnamed protein product, partial [Heterosigma akashiwo]
ANKKPKPRRRPQNQPQNPKMALSLIFSRGIRRQLPTASRLGPLHLAKRWLSALPDHELVVMPALSPTMEAGTLGKWNVQPGQAFEPGDVLAEVETDKATVDFEAQDEGVVAKLLVAAGAADVPCGAPILVVVQDAADVAAFADFAV